MNTTSKRTPLLLLAITAIAGSKILFALLNDPEGTNLLVVLGMAFIIYVISGLIYLKSSVVGGKRFWVVLAVQVLTVIVFYLLLS
jgi:hypothetical protein